MTLESVSVVTLLLMTTAAQAQGVISSVVPPSHVAALPPPLPVAAADSLSRGAVNPFIPHAVAPPELHSSPPRPPPAPVDPVRAALMEEARKTREQGVHLGFVNGQAIYRREGHYLIENSRANLGAMKLLESWGAGADATQCVIHIVHLPSDPKSDPRQLNGAPERIPNTPADDAKPNR